MFAIKFYWVLNAEINIIKGLHVFMIAACYLFITTTHIFFLPRLTHSGRKHNAAYSSVFKRKNKDVMISSAIMYSLHRLHKVILNEKKPAIDALKGITSFFILLFLGLQCWRKKNKLFADVPILVSNYQYSYLSFCTFKIWINPHPDSGNSAWITFFKFRYPIIHR